MKIDRKKAKAAFEKYTSAYDNTNNLINLKVEHTYRVASICDEIAMGMGISCDDTDLAWLLGLLHDVGRFEQLRVYGTLNDAKSVNHAEYSVKVLFDDRNIEDYIDIDTQSYDYSNHVNLENETNIKDTDINDNQTLKLIYEAIKYHNVYRVPESMDKRTRFFCDLLRDADKIDIIKVNCMTPIEQIYPVTKEEVMTSKISEEIMKDYMGHSAVLRSNKRTAIDHLVGHISLAFELVHNISYKILDKQGYIYQLLDFKSLNEETKMQFEQIRQEMNSFINTKLMET